jgi:hypothetical protein
MKNNNYNIQQPTLTVFNGNVYKGGNFIGSVIYSDDKIIQFVKERGEIETIFVTK